MNVPGNVHCDRDLGIKDQTLLKVCQGLGNEGQQGPTVPHSEMVAVQKDTASNLAWRRDGLFLFVGFFFFFFWKILSLGKAKKAREDCGAAYAEAGV